MHAPLNVVRFNLEWEKIQGDYLDAELLESPVVLSSQAGFNLLIEPFFPERETTFNGDGFNRRLFNQSIFRSPLISATYFNSSADGDILLEGLPDTVFSFSTLSGEWSIIYHESGQSEAGATFTVAPDIVMHEIFHDAVSTFTDTIISGRVLGQRIHPYSRSLFNYSGFNEAVFNNSLHIGVYKSEVITQTEGDADRTVDAGINILPVVYGELGRGDLIYQAVNLVSASSFFSQSSAQRVYELILAGHEIGSVFTIDMLIRDYLIEISVYMFGPEHLQTIKHGSYDLDVVKYEPEVIKV